MSKPTPLSFTKKTSSPPTRRQPTWILAASAWPLARALGAEVGAPSFDIVLPLGISFYTFETIAYVTDVYRRRIPAERNPLDYSLFLLFFPHLIAGPIIRQSGDGDAGALAYLNDGYFHDLLVWYHLGWLGYSVRHREEARRLFDKGGGYTAEDRTTLVRIIHECIDGIIPRYRAMSERGQIELSMTPWGHPIVPLLNDFNGVRW